MPDPPRHSYASLITALGAALVFVTVFIVDSAIMLWVLWDFVYGDTHGGRWQFLAWPSGFLAALLATGLFLAWRTRGVRISAKLLLGCALAWVVANVLWVALFGAWVMRVTAGWM